MCFVKVLQSDEQVICAYQARRNVSIRCEGGIKRGRSPGWKLVRTEHSRLCIYAFVEIQFEDQEVHDQSESIANIRNDSTYVPAILDVQKK